MNRKTCPLSGRVVPCEGRGWKLRGDGVGMPYRFFPSPRVVEVKRAYVVEFDNILFVVTTLNLA